MKISEIITDKYKLRIPPTVYYELLADVQEIEEKQEATTKNDLGVDCISRAEMLKYQEYLHGKMSNEENHKLWEFIKELPSVTPQEPKTGRWIANAPQYDMLNPQYICSECGNAHTRTTPYCEMCGAKMVEPQESEDKE